MANDIKYKGYCGTITYNAEEKFFYGKVLGTTDSISYEGASLSELETDFHAAIDDYLSTEKVHDNT